MESVPTKDFNTKFQINQTHLKCGTKVALFGHFWEAILQNYWHFRNQHSRSCGTVKFHQKQKNFKHETKFFLFGYF